MLYNLASTFYFCLRLKNFNQWQTKNGWCKTREIERLKWWFENFFFLLSTSWTTWAMTSLRWKRLWTRKASDCRACSDAPFRRRRWEWRRQNIRAKTLSWDETTFGKGFLKFVCFVIEIFDRKQLHEKEKNFIDSNIFRGSEMQSCFWSTILYNL